MIFLYRQPGHLLSFNASRMDVDFYKVLDKPKRTEYTFTVTVISLLVFVRSSKGIVMQNLVNSLIIQRNLLRYRVRNSLLYRELLLIS